MIKRIQFPRATIERDPFEAAWPGAVAAASAAPGAARPVRVVACTAVPDAGAPAEHDGLAFEWFADAPHLARYESWLGTDAGRAATAGLEAIRDEVVEPIVADEHVLRGEDWLDRHWRDGGPAFKHVAVARRAHGLTPAQFAERWSGHAGTAPGRGQPQAVVIPEDVRGLAYAQNRPHRRPGGEWAYDAVNEVWFDDLDALRARADWFRANVGEDAQSDLFSQNRFLLLREEVVIP